MNDNRITTRLSEKLIALLKEQSHQRKVTVSDIVRSALEQHLINPSASLLPPSHVL
jgi:predicted DNA binding CopG/RHH family protein